MHRFLAGLLIASVLAGCASEGGQAPPFDPTDIAPQARSRVVANATTEGALAWLFRVNATAGEGEMDCEGSVSATGRSEGVAPVVGIARWVSSEEAAAFDPRWGGVETLVFNNGAGSPVSASAEGTLLEPVPAPVPGDWSLESTWPMRGESEVLAVQFHDLAHHGETANGTTAQVIVDCKGGVVDGPQVIGPAGLFSAAEATNGVALRTTTGTGLRFIEADGQLSLAWNVPASLVVGAVADGHGSGVKRVVLDSGAGTTEWLFHENGDLAGTGDGTFFGLDWGASERRVTLDSAGAMALASDTEILFFDLSATCPQEESCSLPIPPAADPTLP